MANSLAETIYVRNGPNRHPFGIDGYRLAIHGLAARIGVTARA
jgi:hypothetical protein